MNSNPKNDYAYINEGQLKQFTARAVDELNARLATNGGAGPALSNLAYNWHQDYAAHGPSTNDDVLMTVGQLKTVGGMVYGQLSSAGYTGLYPSWLHQNTNSDNDYANIGQLKTVFDFDLTVAPGAVSNLVASNGNPNEIDLSWTLPAVNNAQLILIEQSADDGSTWTTTATISDPTSTSYADTSAPDGTDLEFRVTLSNAAGSSSPTVDPTPIVKITPRYAVIDLGVGMQPQKITNSGYILSSVFTSFPAMPWEGYLSSYRWHNGTSSLLVPADALSYAYAFDIAEDGTAVGEEASSPYPPITELIWSPTGLTPLELTDPNGSSTFSEIAGVATTGGSSPVWSMELVEGPADADNPYYDGFHGLGELGSVSWTPIWIYEIPNGPVDFPQMVNDQGDLLSEAGTYVDGVLSSTYTAYINHQPVGFTPTGISNEINGTTFAVGNGFDANGNNILEYWDGSQAHKFDNGGGAPAMNGASALINGTNTPAFQIVNGASLYSMNPVTQQIGSPVNVNTLIPSNQNWSGFSAGSMNSPSSGMPGAIIDVPGSTWGASHAINDYGAIVGTATYTPTNSDGTPGTPVQHGALLLPCQFSLLNGNQSGTDGLNFDGTRPTKISQTSPDNPIANLNINDNGGYDILGIVNPFGSGRTDIPDDAYTYSLMLAAKVSPATAITYSWNRVYLDRSVTIIKTLNPTTNTYYWYVKSINSSKNPTGFPTPVPDADDTGDETTTPSTNRILYSYDAPAMNLGLFHACNTNDYAYEECDYTYTLTISVGVAATTATMHVGNVITAQRTSVTLFGLASDWTGKSNIASTSNIPDCQMPNDPAHIAIIRSIVGGSLPIVIDSHANDPNPNP